MDTLQQQTRVLELKDNCVQFMFAYQQKEVDKMMSYCDPEGEVYFKPLGEAGRGKIGELGKQLWTLLCDCFPDIHNTVDAIASEDDCVRCQVLISGTQEKDFAGIPNQGGHFDSDHIFVFQVNENDKIDRIEIDWDHQDFVRQLSKSSHY